MGPTRGERRRHSEIEPESFTLYEGGKEGVHCDPAPAGSFLQQAEKLANQGRLDEARTLCERRLAQDSLDAQAYLLLGTISQEQGDLSSAVAALGRCIFLAPQSAVAHYVLGGLLQRQGQPRQARRSFETVLHLLHTAMPDDPVVGGEGLTAGRLAELARAQAAALRPGAGRERGNPARGAVPA